MFREAKAREALDRSYDLGTTALGDPAAPGADLVLGALNAMRDVLRSSETDKSD